MEKQKKICYYLYRVAYTEGVFLMTNNYLEEYDYRKNEEVYQGIHNYAQSVVNKFPKNERTIIGILSDNGMLQRQK